MHTYIDIPDDPTLTGVSCQVFHKPVLRCANISALTKLVAMAGELFEPTIDTHLLSSVWLD